jgi:hypothetical protein
VILWPRVLGEGHELSVREFLKIYKPSRNPKSEFTFNFQGRHKTKFILLSRYSSNKHWKDKFFFTQGDWEFSATEIVASPRVPREACHLSSSGQEEPILNESEDAHVREMTKYSEEHSSKMEFNAIFSQSTLTTYVKYPPAEGPTGSKLKKKRKVTTLQISEPQSAEAAKQKSIVLPSNKLPNEVEVERSSEIL